jgi:hypothetical protein
MNSELDKLLRKELNLGAVEPSRIHHIKDSRLPQFEFEWHTATQKVYRLDLPGRWEDKVWIEEGIQAKGCCIAEHCLTHGMFIGFVQTFCRGYLLAVKHRNTGSLETYAPTRIVTEDDPCPTR